MIRTFLISIFFLLNTDLLQAKEIIKTTISGMVCPMCAQNIEKSFKGSIKDKTIAKFDVDLDTKIVTFELADNKKLSDEQITTGIKNAGYLVKKIERLKQ